MSIEHVLCPCEQHVHEELLARSVARYSVYFLGNQNHAPTCEMGVVSSFPLRTRVSNCSGTGISTGSSSSFCVRQYKSVPLISDTCKVCKVLWLNRESLCLLHIRKVLLRFAKTVWNIVATNQVVTSKERNGKRVKTRLR